MPRKKKYKVIRTIVFHKWIEASSKELAIQRAKDKAYEGWSENPVTFRIADGGKR